MGQVSIGLCTETWRTWRRRGGPAAFGIILQRIEPSSVQWHETGLSAATKSAGESAIPACARECR